MWLAWIALAPPGHAFEVLRSDGDEPLAWWFTPIGYSVNAAGAPAGLNVQVQEAALAEAFAAWAAVEWPSEEQGNLAFDYLGRTFEQQTLYGPAEGATGDRNVIFWDTGWDRDPDVLALTSTWSTTAGEIVGFDIRINGRTIDWGAGGMDFQNAMTHEVGHALGFDHSFVEEATMAGTTRRGETDKRDLHLDDEDGVRFLYAGIERAYGASLFGCSTAPGLPWLALPAALFALRRRQS